MMFEETNPLSDPPHALVAAYRAKDGARPGRTDSPPLGERFGSRPARRAHEALRAVEWSEITARLNAARDLRLLMRTESQANIELVAASFGDAAASYFALLDDGERDVNPDALGQPKVLGGMLAGDKATPAADQTVGAASGDARDML